jgi:hypothetical protein
MTMRALERRICGVGGTTRAPQPPGDLLGLQSCRTSAWSWRAQPSGELLRLLAGRLA